MGEGVGDTVAEHVGYDRLCACVVRATRYMLEGERRRRLEGWSQATCRADAGARDAGMRRASLEACA